MTQKIRLYLFLFLACFSTRFVCLAFNFPSLDFKSNISYHWLLSDDLLRYGTLSIEGVKTTSFEPLYPLFLAAVRSLFENHLCVVLIAQIWIAVIGCFYLYELSFLLSGNSRVSFIASFIYTIYPYLIYQTATISEVTLLTTLLIASAYYYAKAMDVKNAVFSGICLGLSILTRSASFPILILGFCVLILKKWYRQAFAFIASAFLIFSPMLIRNHQINGSLLPTRGGENLFDGNSEYSDKLIPAYSLDLLTPYVHQILKTEYPHEKIKNQKEVDRFFTQKAMEFMMKHPVRTLKLKLMNLIYLFYPRIIPFYPMNASALFIWDENGNYHVINSTQRGLCKELIYSIPYTFIFLTAVFGIYHRRNDFQTDLILYLIAFSFTAVYSIYFPTTRLQSPMDFVLMFYSAFAIDYFLKRFEIPRWTPTTKHSV